VGYAFALFQFQLLAETDFLHPTVPFTLYSTALKNLTVALL
jgi:hypothetical protein